ncbi:MAG: peptidylprolyl isomerase [Candidatus Rokuibacteriota bacterium]
MRRAPVIVVLALVLGGCAMPQWVPFFGKKGPAAPTVRLRPAPETPAPPAPARAARAAPPGEDGAVTDRIVAVVNNDAITLAELQESIVAYRQESRGQASVTDEELGRQFLTRLIDTRLQLQEADREKISVDELEVEDELAQRMKRFGVTTRGQMEELVKAQGLTLDHVRRRVREAIRVSKVIRRKVTLRVSVTEAEIDRYLAENRTKLETGLSYHARHILVPPTGTTDADWEAARIRAGVIRAQLLEGADFAALAQQHSRDASARSGGDLGTLKRGELAADIEAVILALGPGELSLPYRSAYGYHLFRLESKESLEGDGLASARQQIREILFRQKYEARLDAWLKEVKQRAIIEVRL